VKTLIFNIEKVICLCTSYGVQHCNIDSSRVFDDVKLRSNGVRAQTENRNSPLSHGNRIHLVLSKTLEPFTVNSCSVGITPKRSSDADYF